MSETPKAPELQEIPKGMNLLRRATSLFSNGPESFNDQFSAMELLRLYRCWFQAEYDIPPWQWTERQLSECLKRKRVPEWNEDKKPVYRKKDR